MEHISEPNADNTDEAEQNAKYVPITLTTTSIDDIRARVRDALEKDKRRQAASQKADTIASQSSALSAGARGSLSVTTDSTAELKTLQDAVGIDESTVRNLQEEHDLQRLHPARRKEFIEEILRTRIKDHADSVVAETSTELDETADATMAEFFGQPGETVTKRWWQGDAGTFTQREKDESEPVTTVSIENATTDSGKLPGKYMQPDVYVLEDESTVTIESRYGTGTLTVDAGGYSFSHQPLETIAAKAGLIEVESRDASCTSSDKEALDVAIGRGEAKEKAHIIKLQSGDGGYSNRYVKAWTEFRDFDPERQMLLVNLGQASYYRSSMRGKSERAWLIGQDDDQIWCQQVYTTHETVDEALDFITPAEVQNYREEGRKVIRQGDIFFVQMKQATNFEDLNGTRHDVVEQDDGQTVITHPEHSDLTLEGHWKAYTNNDGSQSSSTRTRRIRD